MDKKPTDSERQQTRSGDSAQPAPPAACVEIKALPAEFSGKILSERNDAIEFLVTMAHGLVIFGIASIGFAGALMAFPDKIPVGGVNPFAKYCGIFLMCVGFGSLAPMIFIFLANPSLASNRWRHRIARRALKSRPANLVNPDAVESHLVAIVPKLNWEKMALEGATELGFLTVDKQRGLILFEGDHECIRIPAQAITSCVMESHLQKRGTHQWIDYYAVLRAHHPDGFWEAPLKSRSAKGIFHIGQRIRATVQLIQEINSIRDSATLPADHLGPQTGCVAS